MVHALQAAHRLLRPGGVLIDIHSLPVPDLIEVHSPGSTSKVGWISDREDFQSERAAFNALLQQVEEGHFVLEDQRDFDFDIYSENLGELQAWLAEWWSSAVLSNRTLRRMEAAMREAGRQARIVLVVPTRMTKFSAQGTGPHRKPR